jgi:RNA recognition motif-containing protein
VLFEKKEDAQAARTALNQTKFQDKHLRVDLTIHERDPEAGKKGRVG